MEKDYFDDRSYQAIHNSLIKEGDVVVICTKEAQKYASTMEHLIRGIVVKKLTTVKKHPRGIKVRVAKIQDDRYPTQEEINFILQFYRENEYEIESEMTRLSEKFEKGRITYIISKDNKIIRG